MDRLIWVHGAQEMVRISLTKVSKGQRAEATRNSSRVVRREVGVTPVREKSPSLA